MIHEGLILHVNRRDIMRQRRTAACLNFLQKPSSLIKHYYNLTVVNLANVRRFEHWLSNVIAQKLILDNFLTKKKVQMSFNIYNESFNLYRNTVRPENLQSALHFIFIFILLYLFACNVFICCCLFL